MCCGGLTAPPISGTVVAGCSPDSFELAIVPTSKHNGISPNLSPSAFWLPPSFPRPERALVTQGPLAGNERLKEFQRVSARLAHFLPGSLAHPVIYMTKFRFFVSATVLPPIPAALE